MHVLASAYTYTHRYTQKLLTKTDRVYQKYVSYIPGLKSLPKRHPAPGPGFSPFYLVSYK